MNYAEARPLTQSGDLIALTHKKFGSVYDLEVQAVRFFTQSEYAHVAIVWAIGGRLWVIEAVEPLVRMVPLSHFAEEGYFWIPMDAPMTGDELEHALAKVGNAHYSKWQAIKAYFGLLKIGADEFEECAEFTIGCRRLSGVDLGNVATPSAVVQAALDLGKAVHFVKQ